MITPVVFHIGFHKTGTSYLQSRVFERFPERFHRVPQRRIYDSLIYPDPLSFDEVDAGVFFESHLEMAGRSQTMAVFSNERLSGGLHDGGYDSKEIAHRIHALASNAKIIIGIREQEDMIHSAYSQYVRAVGSCSLNEYLNPTTKKNKSLFHFSYLEYHRLIDCYVRLFGKENVLVLPYEMLRLNRDRYIQLVLSFLGCLELLPTILAEPNRKVNESLKPAVLALKRHLNPFILQGHPYLGNTLYSPWVATLARGLFKLVSVLTPAGYNQKLLGHQKARIKQLVGNRYEASNRLTQAFLKDDLAALGYRL